MVKDIFKIIDEQIKKINSMTPEVELIELYYNFFEELKKQKGTSTSFTGISELLFFRYIKNYIEKITNGEFIIEKHTKDTNRFCLDNIILTHDINIKTISKGLPKYKIDIAIFNQENKEKVELIGVFEIKTYISTGAILKNLYVELKELAKESNAILFPVLFFSNQYRKEFNDICNEYHDRIFVISKNKEYKYHMNLKEALDRILNKMNISK